MTTPTRHNISRLLAALVTIAIAATTLLAAAGPAAAHARNGPGGSSGTGGSQTFDPKPSSSPDARTDAARLRDAIEFPSTPYMGVDTWYAFWRDIDQAVIVRFTNEMVRRGLKRAGYRYVWLDAGWWEGTRNSRGQIVVNRQQWPYGMKWLVWYIHSKGLLAGIYTDAGSDGCQNAGSFKHYRADVDTFARWGFDAVKVDFCGGRELHLSPSAAYRAFAGAINDDQPHRPLLLAICNGSVPVPGDPYGAKSYAQSAYASYEFAPKIAASWRTGPDEGVPGDVTFSGVLRSVELDARHPRAAGRGHWNDPDYLTPDQGLSYQQDRAQFTIWAMLAAPLMLSTNIGMMSTRVVRMYENRTVIGIDQDALAIQGRRIRRWRRISLWVKPLEGGRLAVAFLNKSRRWASASASESMLGLPKAKSYTVEDVWGHDTGRTKHALHVGVPADGAVLLIVTPYTPPPKPPKSH